MSNIKVMENANLSEPQSIGLRAISGAAWMIAFRMFSRGIGFASTLVLARLLSTSDFGIVAIAFTLSAALNSMSNVGVTENLVRYKTVERAEFDTGFTIQLIRGCLTGLLLVGVAPLAADWFSEPRLINIVYVMAGIFVLAGFENIGIINFRRNMQFDREFKLSAVERVLAFVATLAAALLFHSYWALVIGMLVGKVTRVISTHVMEPYRPRFGLQAWGEMAGFSLWMWLSSLVYIVWLRADPLVIGSQVPKAVLGLYVIALDIALLPATEIMEPIGAVLFAGFAAERNAGRDPRGNAFKLAVSLMSMMAPIALVLSASSTYIVGVLLGPKWIAAAPLVAILTFAVVLSPFSNTAAQSLTASGKIRANLVVVLCASTIKVIVLYFASRTGDLITVAISALTITSAEASLFIYMLYRNGSKFSGLIWSVIRSMLSFAIAALALRATGIAWAGEEIFPILVCMWRGALLGLVGVSVYTSVLFGAWFLAGRPAGSEHQIVGLVLPHLDRLAQQFRRS